MNAHDGLVPKQIHPHTAHGAHGVEQGPGILHIPQLTASGSVGVPVRDAVPGVCPIRVRHAEKLGGNSTHAEHQYQVLILEDTHDVVE